LGQVTSLGHLPMSKQETVVLIQQRSWTIRLQCLLFTYSPLSNGLYT